MSCYELWHWIFVFYKFWGISSLSEQLAACFRQLCSIKWIINLHAITTEQRIIANWCLLYGLLFRIFYCRWPDLCCDVLMLGFLIEHNEMGKHVACMGEKTGVCRVLVGKPEGRRPLGRPSCRWEDNMKMDLQEVWCGGMDWINLAQDRDRCQAVVNVVMKLRVPSNAGNFLTSWEPVSFSKRTLLLGVSK